MKTLAQLQYADAESAMIAAHTTSMDYLVSAMGDVPNGTYFYLNDSNQIEAATVGTDATPADEVELIGRYHRDYN